MKPIRNILPVALLAFALTGCMSPNFTRLIPENKDANIFILSPLYGQVIIQTRVNPAGTNTLPGLTTETPRLILAPE